MTPLKAVRAYCMSCSGDNRAEVKRCVITDCPLYQYRLGKNPKRAGKGGNTKALESYRKSRAEIGVPA